ncbi:conserved protein of unknown function [Tenacibaculum sp. 190524A02b]|uniref:hypothetical protein n=1 Tax=Tenacibaculum vairaonense TaxID=3137860 RepID=UPI0032B26D23
METILKIWEDRIFPNVNDNLIIEFEIPTGGSKNDFEISSKIFWKKSNQDVYHPEKITTTTPCNLLYSFHNGISIKGKLSIKNFSSFNSSYTLGVFADFYYFNKTDVNYIWHTEGFLIGFDPDFKKNVKDPSKKPPKDKPTPLDPIISSDTYSDLFPYIYVTDWPKIASSEIKWNFFYYQPYSKGLPIDSFTDKLSFLKKTNNRLGMQQEAILFIEGKPPYNSQFVSNTTKLPGYLTNFKALYNQLITSKSLTSIVAQTCAFFQTNIPDFSTYLKSTTYLESKERLWDSYFALIIEMGYEHEQLTSIIEVLTLCNFLEIIFKHIDEEHPTSTFSKEQLSSLLNATIILYKGIFPLPPYPSSPPISAQSTFIPYAIGNLQLVKYKLSHYEIGELANILSLMPGEKRKLTNKKINRTVTKEISKTSSIDNSYNATNQSNNDFNEELWNAIAETSETTDYPNPGLISTYGPPTNITIKGSYTKKKTTQKPDKKQLASFAKKVLNKTAKRLSDKVNKIRTHSELRELEDTTVSTITNKKNNFPEYGFYCWLNKVYKTKVINYGNRMLFSFDIPHPAKDYIEQTIVLKGLDLKKPKSLSDFHINSYKDINQENYLTVAQYYNLKKFNLYPQETIIISEVISLSQSKLIDLPDAYYAGSATIEYAFGSQQSNSIVNGFIGQHSFSFQQSEGVTGTKKIPSLNGEQNKIAASAVYNTNIEMSPPNSEIEFQMSISIECLPLPNTILSWQIEMYDLFDNAYTKESTIYHEETKASNSKKELKNPLEERLIVINSIEKSVRKLLLQNVLRINGYSSNLINKNVPPSFNFNQPEITQYLNKVLEWSEMSYTFFDQYSNTNNHFAISSASPNFFSAFLNADYVRVLIPVFPEFNQSFLYFLSTGSIWASLDKLTPCFEDSETTTEIIKDQKSIIYEIKKIFQHSETNSKVIDSWEICIPTSMQILQEKKHMNIKNHK